MILGVIWLFWCLMGILAIFGDFIYLVNLEVFLVILEAF
jgi:hypothetical protein